MPFKGMLREMLVFPSPMYASCGSAAEKSTPGFAVPDSVHQVKFVSPRRLPLRCTGTCADGSPAGTSTVSVASSIFDGLEGAGADGARPGIAADGAAPGVAADGGAAAGGGAAASDGDVESAGVAAAEGTVEFGEGELEL